MHALILLTCTRVSSSSSLYIRHNWPNVTRDGGIQVVAINMTDASSYYTHPDEDVLKEHIKKVGKTNVSLDFLRDTSTDTSVHPRANGKKKKCVVIPHNPSVPEEILQQLFQGKCQIHLSSDEYNFQATMSVVNAFSMQLLG